MNRPGGRAALVIGVVTATIPTYVLFQAVTFLFVVPLLLGHVCIGLGVLALRTKSRFLRHVGLLAAVLMLIAILLPLGMIAYNSRSGYPIVMVIPEGYRGPVKLVIDRKEGVDVPLEDGKYTFHLPRSGTLRIKDDSPFRQWHSMTAFYTNGEPIPTDDEDHLPPDVVSLHSLGSGVKIQGGTQEEYIEDFVGTKAEFRTYVDDVRR
jgi:hypothetical protein